MILTSLVVGLVATALALSFARFTLIGHANAVQVDRQRFRLHAIRDELQDLVMEGALSENTLTHQFLETTVNIGIANAGSMRLKDILALSRRVDEVAGRVRVDLLDELKQQDERVGALAAETFHALTETLIANDRLVRWGFHAAVSATTVARWLVEGMRPIAKALIPERAAAVDYARSFHGYRTELGGIIA